MKSYKELLATYTPEEVAESFVFPNTMSKRDTELAMKELKKARNRLAAQYAAENKLQLSLIP